jgi:hypothetical protein
MANCNICGSPIPETGDTCGTCGSHIGFPNVRAAEAEQGPLTIRYEAAIAVARTQGTHDAVLKFDASMKKTFAVVNVDLRFLFHFLSNDKLLYSTYQLGVRSETRKAANAENDRHRVGVEGTFFGSDGSKIRYAALSLDGSGLKSYGGYSIRLRDVAVAHRATLLEENTYAFVEHHDIIAGHPAPPGYRGVWAERHKLAVAKLGARLLPTTEEKDHAGLLLENAGKRPDDNFIEVHIYGPLDGNAIESVKGKSRIRNNPERALAASAKQYLLNAGKVWIEE